MNLCATVMPKIFPFTFGEEDYMAGMSAQLNCMVIGGDTPVDIHWNVVAQSHSSVLGITTTKFGTKSSVLQIDSLDASHSGNYTCTASNKAGTVYHSAQLTVVGTPITNFISTNQVILPTLSPTFTAIFSAPCHVQQILKLSCIDSDRIS